MKKLVILIFLALSFSLAQNQAFEISPSLENNLTKELEAINKFYKDDALKATSAFLELENYVSEAIFAELLKLIGIAPPEPKTPDFPTIEPYDYDAVLASLLAYYDLALADLEENASPEDYTKGLEKTYSAITNRLEVEGIDIFAAYRGLSANELVDKFSRNELNDAAKKLNLDTSGSNLAVAERIYTALK